jgi:hypothetical protein
MQPVTHGALVWPTNYLTQFPGLRGLCRSISSAQLITERRLHPLAPCIFLIKLHQRSVQESLSTLVCPALRLFASLSQSAHIHMYERIKLSWCSSARIYICICSNLARMQLAGGCVCVCTYIIGYINALHALCN